MNIIHLLIKIEIFLLLAYGANLISGYSGLLSLAYASLFAVGAYVNCILMIEFEMPFLFSLVITIFSSTVIGAILTFFASRLQGLNFAIVTLAIQVIIYNILYNSKITGGSVGLIDITDIKILNFNIDSDIEYLILTTTLIILAILFQIRLKSTQFIKALEAIRDQKLGALSFGKNISSRFFQIHIIAGIYFSLAGSIYACYNSFIDPTMFTISDSILILSIILIGGTGTVIGPLVGTIFYLLLPEVFRLFPISGAQGASLRMIVYGVILMIVVIYKPNGFFGKYKFQ